MRKFTTPVCMRVTKQQFEQDFKIQLKNLGYYQGGMSNWIEEPFLCTIPENGVYCNSRTSYPLHIDCYNPELFLAVAAMSEGRNYPGELIYDTETGRISGCLVGSPLWVAGMVSCRKASLQEIFKRFGVDVKSIKSTHIGPIDQPRPVFAQDLKQFLQKYDCDKISGVPIDALVSAVSGFLGIVGQVTHAKAIESKKPTQQMI